MNREQLAFLQPRMEQRLQNELNSRLSSEDPQKVLSEIILKKQYQQAALPDQKFTSEMLQYKQNVIDRLDENLVTSTSLPLTLIDFVFSGKTLAEIYERLAIPSPQH